MSISISTAASAGRFLALIPSLSEAQRQEMLMLLLRLAYTEGGQHIAQTLQADAQTTLAVQKARALS